MGELLFDLYICPRCALQHPVEYQDLSGQGRVGDVCQIATAACSSGKSSKSDMHIITFDEAKLTVDRQSTPSSCLCRAAFAMYQQ